MLYKVLKSIINKKYYTKKDIQERVDVFMAYNRITEEQYAELIELIEEVYGPDEPTSTDQETPEASEV